MSKEEKRSSQSPEHVEIKYEKADVHFGWILALVIAGCCVAATHYFVIWEYFKWQKSTQATKNESLFVPSNEPVTQLPKPPILEPLAQMAKDESVDTFKRLVAKEKTLNSQGPTSEKGFIHIPIQQAIKEIEGKLPVRNENQKQVFKDSGLVDSGESNSGRMFRGESK